MMTRDQQVRTAIKLLGPPAGRREECRDQVENALDDIDFATKHTTYGLGRKKQETASVKRFQAALRRAQIAQNAASDIDTFPVADIDFEKLIAQCEPWLAQPAAPRRRTSFKQQRAVAEARVLISKWHGPARATRSGLWCKLAAVLYGDDKSDMFHHVCRAQERLRNTDKTFRRYVEKLGGSARSRSTKP